MVLETNNNDDTALLGNELPTTTNSHSRSETPIKGVLNGDQLILPRSKKLRAQLSIQDEIDYHAKNLPRYLRLSQTEDEWRDKMEAWNTGADPEGENFVADAVRGRYRTLLQDRTDLSHHRSKWTSCNASRPVTVLKPLCCPQGSPSAIERVVSLVR